MMNSTLSVVFAFADSTTKNFSMGPFDPQSDFIGTFKNRLKNFNSADSTSSRKFTNLAEIVKSDTGAALTGVKSATITTSQTRRIFDASTYRP